jgi:hypothetical protein
MAEQEKSFTTNQTCGHCSNTAPMEIVHTYSQVKDYDDPRSGLSWQAGNVYELLTCPACGGVSLRRYYWHEYMDPDDVKINTVYPSMEDIPQGLPETIEREYRAALKVRSISPNAFGVLLGRLLELVCEDRKATGTKLNDKLKDLADRNEIPAKLVDMANNLQQLRHYGAHATLGELTPSEVPILDKLCRAILEYVYSAPHLVKEAEERLRLLRTVGRKRSGKREKDT